MTGFKPPIKRTVDVPASFTFRDLHCVVQYAFGWDSSHVHMFSFYNQKAKKRGGRYIFNEQNEVLHVKAARNGFKPMFGAVPEDCVVREDQVKLSDVLDDDGKFREVVDMEGKPACPIVYTYDLGVSLPSCACRMPHLTSRDRKTGNTSSPTRERRR